MKSLGTHILVEFFGCRPQKLRDPEFLKKALFAAAKAANAVIVGSEFYPFEGGGVSGMVMIQESHISIHTWPEHQYAAVDIFTCGQKVDPWAACDVLNIRLEASQKMVLELKRGILSQQGGNA